MKTALIEYVRSKKHDDFSTPHHAVSPLLRYLPPPPLRVWEPTDPGHSQISKILRLRGYDVISTDIKTGFDFLKDRPDFEFDAIISDDSPD